MSPFKKYIITLIIIVVLAIAWYGLSPLFRNIEVNDPVPEVAVDMVGRETEPSSETLTSSEEDMLARQADLRSPVIATTAHPASGFVRILDTPDGTTIRYEDFQTINGPNLHVYLAKDLKATEYVDLGPIKGTQGNINYPVPDDIDISEYKYVMYWCVPFSVLFNYAEI